MARKKHHDAQTKRPLSLYRTRGQDVGWTLRSRWFRGLVVGVVALAGAGTVYANWSTVEWAYERAASGFAPETPAWQSVQAQTALSDDYATAFAKATSGLSASIGRADEVIAAKTTEGVSADEITPVKNLRDAAQGLADSGNKFVTPLTAADSSLSAAVEKLRAAKAPAIETPDTSTDNTSAGSNNGGSNSDNTGGSTGNGNTGGGGGGSSTPQTLSTSASVTCPLGKVTARATGGGTVSVTISGPNGVSSSGSGSGSATATVAGAQGSYTASATGQGSIAISSLSCG